MSATSPRTSLWSLRNTASRGWVWHKERDVLHDNAANWLIEYAKDEPGVEFRVSSTKPKLPAELRGRFARN